jgi:GTP-binding protein Era
VSGTTRSGFAALVGWTNVGKSTLLNRLVGEKVAAVADAPQTTRNRIVGVRTLDDRAQAVFVDTPGFHRPRHRMNRAMIETARQSLGGVDLILFVVDSARGLGAGEEEIAGLLRTARAVRIGVLNKLDAVRPKEKLLPMMSRMADAWGVSESIPVSALTGEGCEVLLDRVVALLPEGPFYFPADAFTDQPERSLAAEWIREKLARHTRQELPHSTAVVVDRWEERPDGVIAVEASILVERDSQKAIVIGKGGALLKQVGSEARQDIETLLGARVFLRLWVKVRPDWRDDEATLADLGLR